MTTAKKSDAMVLRIGQDAINIACETSLLTQAQLGLLAAPTPAKWVKKRQGRGGKTFDYVEINYVVGILNAIFGFDWSVEVLDKIIDTKSDSIVILVRLNVAFANGKSINKDAFGGSDIKRTAKGDIIDLADDLKAAQSDAIKKAASMLGVAWDVYSGLTKSNGNRSEDDFIDAAADDDPFGNAVTAETANMSKNDAFRTVELMMSDGKKRKFTKFEAYAKFGKLKEVLGEKDYYATLKLAGHAHANEIADKMLPAVFAMLLERTKK